MSQKKARGGLSDSILAEFEMFTPKTGYNLVGIDKWAIPGEKMYLIRHYETYQAAHRALAGLERHGYCANVLPLGRRKDRRKSRAR